MTKLSIIKVNVVHSSGINPAAKAPCHLKTKTEDLTQLDDDGSALSLISVLLSCRLSTKTSDSNIIEVETGSLWLLYIKLTLCRVSHISERSNYLCYPIL